MCFCFSVCEKLTECVLIYTQRNENSRPHTPFTHNTCKHLHQQTTMIKPIINYTIILCKCTCTCMYRHTHGLLLCNRSEQGSTVLTHYFGVYHLWAHNITSFCCHKYSLLSVIIMNFGTWFVIIFTVHAQLPVAKCMWYSNLNTHLAIRHNSLISAGPLSLRLLPVEIHV